MPIDIPIFGARSAIWMAAQLHLYFAAFVLGAPIFIVICEYLGRRRQDGRYERLAKETMKVVAIAYSFTALTGMAFTFVLVGPYQGVASHLFGRFWPVFVLYALLIFAETILMYLYWYTWEALAARKGLHISIGVALNVVGTVVMLLMNAVGAYMLTPPESGQAAGLWEAINNASWSGLSLHRFIANITFGGFMVALFAAFMFLSAKKEEDRAFYDWMGYIGNFIGVASLMALPLAGYIYAKELFLYDATISTFLMADKLHSFFVMQGVLVSLLFLGANYYMWMSIRRISGAEPFFGYMRPTFAVILVGAIIWLTPQSFLPDLVTPPPTGMPLASLVIPERAAFIGLMMAKAVAVTAIILFTFLTYMIYLRALSGGNIQWGRIASQSQYALIFTPTVAVFLMGLMGAVRELARQDWHVYGDLRDVTPYWYTTPLAQTSINVGLATLTFFVAMAFIFWVGFKLGKAE